jgi:hypothetical protein
MAEDLGPIEDADEGRLETKQEDNLQHECDRPRMTVSATC